MHYHIHFEIKITQTYTTLPGISLSMRPANESYRYIVTTSLIGWAHTQTDPRISSTESVTANTKSDFD